jgi:type I restriction enzyme M protein
LISHSLAHHRLDYSFLASQKNQTQNQKISIRDVTVLMRRGYISSSDRNSLQYPVLHTSDINSFTDYIDSNFLLDSKQKALVTSTLAESGDILIARVGRNLHEKVCRVKKGPVAISDCIFLLRVEKKYRQIVFDFLKSEEGRSALSNAGQGVSAKFLTTDSILNLRF